MKKKVTTKAKAPINEVEHDIKLLERLKELGIETYEYKGLKVSFNHSVKVTETKSISLKPTEKEIDLDELAFQTAMGKGFSNEQ